MMPSSLEEIGQAPWRRKQEVMFWLQSAYANQNKTITNINQAYFY